MGKITDIRSRQVIDLSMIELASCASLMLGMEFAVYEDMSGFTVTQEASRLTAVGQVFNVCFGGSNFGNLESVIACAADIQTEQLNMVTEERDQLLAALMACANKLRAEDIRSGLPASSELENAMEIIATVCGVKL